MRRRNHSSRIARAVFIAMSLPLCAGVGYDAAAAPNEMRWEGHAAAIAHAVAWQQEDRDGRWVTFVLLTDHQVPPAMLTDTNALDPELLPQDKQIAKRIGAQGLLFSVLTGGIPVPDGKAYQPGYSIWFHDGKELRPTKVSGTGGVDIELLTAQRIKGRAIHGRANDESAWSIAFDVAVAGGSAARMAAEGEALGTDGGLPGKHLVAALDAIRKKDHAALAAYASPDMAEFLKGAGQREKRMVLLQANAGDSQQIVNGLRKRDEARVYWIKKWKDPKLRNLRCTDTMSLRNGTWRSMESNCAAE